MNDKNLKIHDWGQFRNMSLRHPFIGELGEMRGNDSCKLVWEGQYTEQAYFH